ncbi:MAG: DUF2284 domain-containing protein [Prolixibacteraceae bacterium]|nr:DUF2284 domain-containing protein [Prolixibacteraceae bacterium]
MDIKNQIEQLIKPGDGFKHKWINTGDIVVAQWVRVKCQFGCSDYGLGACPPNTPTVDECRVFFGEYKLALAFLFQVEADKDNYPSAWSKRATRMLLETERKIFLAGYPKAFLLNQTCCCECNPCPGTRLDCTDKKNARPSPEAFAVDVYQTIKNIGWEIHVINKNPSIINRVALIMVD